MPFPIFDTQEAVPEAIRSEYEERDGKWHAKVPDVAGAQSALAAEKQRAKDEEKARRKAEADLVELRRSIDAKANGITDEQLQTLRDEDATKRKPIEDENTALKAEIDQVRRTDKVRAEALGAGVMPDRLEVAMLLLDKRTTRTESGAIVVLDKEGKATTETLDAFLSKTFKAENPWMYEYEGGSGSGTPPGVDLNQQPREPQRDIAAKKRREPAYGGF